MSDLLLSWYERELSLLYSGSKVFAEEHPQLAKHLGVKQSQVADPHVARLCEAIALLNARLRKQLSEESSQLSSSLLNVIFPLCVQPLPSAGMICIPPSANQSQVYSLTSGTDFRVYIDEERYCQFRTTRDLQLLPFDIAHSALELRPFSLKDIKYPEVANSVIRFDFIMLDDSRNFSELASFNEVSVHCAGLIRHQSRVYDDLCRKLCHMVLMDDDGNFVELSNDQFEPVGFSERDCMMSQENCTFIDFQMCLELFSWPELFAGFRLLNVGQLLNTFSSNKVSLLCFLENATEDLMAAVKGIEFHLGCAPVINLFEHIAEPMVIDHRQVSYPLVPDTQTKNKMEVQAVKEVINVTGEEPKLLPPLFGLKHNEKDEGVFWHYHSPDAELDVWGSLSLVYPELNPDQNMTMVLSPHLVCSNGLSTLDIPEKPRVECLGSTAMVSEPVLIMRPTARIRRVLGVKQRLDLLVHLKGAFVDLLHATDQVGYLRTLMSLYCLRNNAISSAWLNALVKMYHRPSVAPVIIRGKHCFIQGLEVFVELDPAQLKEVSIMMFVNLLDFMAAGYVGYHSFIELIICLKGEPGEYMRCSRHHGYQKNH